jgi:hypothetical protein
VGLSSGLQTLSLSHIRLRRRGAAYREWQLLPQVTLGAEERSALVEEILRARDTSIKQIGLMRGREAGGLMEVGGFDWWQIIRWHVYGKGDLGWRLKSVACL